MPGEARQAATCQYYYFCAYSEPNFQGDVRRGATCGVAVGIPWFTYNGSWINNQTSGTRARINYLDGTHWYARGAYSEQSSGMGWYRVGSFVPC